ncbi:MAG TPA: hypothetical protein P5205_03565 [Candidatus Paceibacterota bacterium]|nr:hypothetical protein [Verrucomicrobiota bacterium]HSA09428.1 hypothetical protein [Candidatus Paceibacterota bacterium]
MKAILTCFALAVAPLAARSDMVWSRRFSLESHSSQISTQERIWFWNGFGGYNLFDTLAFSAADVGRTFTISSPADDGDFPAAVGSLTDGMDGQIMILTGTSILSGPVLSESTLFSIVSREGPDLIGYRIDAIQLTIDQLWIGWDYSVNPPWTHTYGSATLSIEAAIIPEPSTPAVGAVGLVLLGVLQGTRSANKSLHRMAARRCLLLSRTSVAGRYR